MRLSHFHLLLKRTCSWQEAEPYYLFCRAAMASVLPEVSKLDATEEHVPEKSRWLCIANVGNVEMRQARRFSQRSLLNTCSIELSFSKLKDPS